ncbi:MAG: isoamylase early set domain-containing protein [Candidatus Bruticola sp.]
MAITKNNTKTDRKSRVTFKLSTDKAGEFNARKVVVVGDFDFCHWDASKGKEMKLLKDGSFSITITLEVGKSYQFKYLINPGDPDCRWENDEAPDKWVTDESGNSNSLVIVEKQG